MFVGSAGWPIESYRLCINVCFSKEQRNDSTIEHELATIRWTIHTCHGFLYCIPFVLYTDHRPLTSMNSMSPQNSIIRFWGEAQPWFWEHSRGCPSQSPQGTGENFSQSLSSLLDGLSVIENIPSGGDSMVRSLCVALSWLASNFKLDLVPPICF